MNKKTALLLSLALILGLTGCGAGRPADGNTPDSGEPSETQSTPSETNTPLETEPAENTPPEPEESPVWQWQFDLPENHSMDPERLAALHAAMEGTQITTMVIARDGVIVDEFYQEGYDETSVVRFNSCSKSVSSALVGIAIDEGLIAGVDVPISQFFPQLVGTDKAQITIRDVLEHRSGITWYEWTGSAVSFWELNEADNWVDYVLDLPMAATPGATFNYSTGGSHLLTAIVDAALGDESVLDYARTRLFQPLGMDSVHWRIDPQGLPDGGNGIEMTARDAAKFGQLFLNGGAWEGQPVISGEWVAASTAVQVRRDGTTNGSYGYQWWIMPMAGYDTFYALGAGGQFILVVPELDLVAVFTSDMPSDTNLPYSYISAYVLAACA